MLLVNSNVVTKIMGGFGNQLFCYACGYAVAKSSNRKLIIDTSQQDNDSFRLVDIIQLNIVYDDRITFKKGNGFLNRAIFNKIKLFGSVGFFTKRIKERQCYSYQDDIFNYNKGNIYLNGYWQSYKYFEKYRAELLEMFTPKVALKKKAIESSQNIRVAIHIRRGDYISIGCNIDLSYYDNAIKYFNNTLPDKPIYYVFSDDIGFAKDFVKKYPDLEMLVVENDSDNQTIEDFYLMASCNHFIIANSSFSWWAAWLGQNTDKIVICPEVDFWTGDFYPTEWIKISAKIDQKEKM